MRGRFHDHLIDLIVHAKRTEACAQMRAWAEEHSYEQLAEDVLVPVLSRFGQLYAATSDTPLSLGYVAAKIAEDAMGMIAEATHRSDPVPVTRGPIVIGNIEDDFHSLGRRIVTTFLKADGWAVHDLGNDVPAETFVSEAVSVGARVIGVSAMMYATAQNICRVREAIDKGQRQDQLRLAVGGAVFVLRPELVAEVGGDGTCRTALGASALMGRLLGEVT